MSSTRVIEQIKERIDLIDVVSRYVTLQKSGQNFKGLCPFHTEKTPSFIVFPSTQTWHCFGACGTGGDVFSFLERAEGLTFGEALERLAEEAGIDLAPPSEADIQRSEALERLKEINATAARYFHHLLLNNPAAQKARDYLLQRKITPAEWETFELGYALDSWDALLNYLITKRQYAVKDVETAGLISKRRDGSGYYDRFRGRIMFPIRDIDGDIIGFGARALSPDDMPKYLNSPETPLFKKSEVLYGMDRARQAIRRAEQAIIVEGYTDVIAAHTHGFENVVASLGTALTEPQLRLLKRYTRRFILALDADTAGSQATLRGLTVAQEALDKTPVPVPTAQGYIRYESRLDADIRVLTLPPGQDPDEMIRQDPDRWEQLVAEAQPIMAFVFQAQTADLDLDDPKGKSEAVRRLLPAIAEIGDPVERTHYLQRLARLVQMDERLLAEQMGRPAATRQRQPIPRPQPSAGPPPAAPIPPRSIFGTEEYLLAALIQHPALHSYLAQAFQQLGTTPLTADDFTQTANREIYTTFFQVWSSDPSVDETTLRHKLQSTLSETLSDQLEYLIRQSAAEPPLPDQERQEAILKAALRLREKTRRREIERLRYVLESAESEAEAETLRRQVQERVVELAQLHRALAGHEIVHKL